MRRGIDVRAMTTLSVGHLAVDFASGSVPALIPFLAERFHLQYVMVGVLLLASALSSSVAQPLFGLWSDRRSAVWLIPTGAMVAALGTGGAAVAPLYGLVLALVFVGGLGIGAFHPEAARFAAYASGRRRASGMSYFTVGGNAGYAFGAFITAQLVVWLGLSGGLVAMAPVAMVALALTRAVAHLPRRMVDVPDAPRVVVHDQRRAMGLLLAVIALRSVTWFALLAFVPLWLVSRGHSTSQGAHALFLMLFAGALGTVVLGPVADRVGMRRTLVVTQALVAPLVLVLLYVGGIVGTISLMLVGACVVGTYGVTVVLGQFYLPRHIGMASGLSIGLATGVGGIAAVVLGAVADSVDLQTALIISAAAPLLGVACALRLPAPAYRPRDAPDAGQTLALPAD